MTEQMEKVKTIDVEKDYRAHGGLNNSLLGYIKKSPKLFLLMKNKQIEQDSKSYFALGDLVHTYILRPEILFDKYYFLKGENPSSPNQVNFCNLVAEGLTPVEAYKKSYVVKNKKDDVIEELSKDLVDKYTDYIEFQKVKDVKIPVKSEEFAIAMACGNATESHKLAGNLLTDYEKEIGINETPIYFNYKGISCKALPDRIIVNHSKKTILLIDLKTTSKGVHDFAYSFKAYSYDRQLAFYTEALKAEYPGYNVKQFIIAVGVDILKECAVYEIGPKYMEEGKRKMDELIDLYLYYEQNGFEYPVEYNKGNGSILLELEDDNGRK